MGQGVDPVRSLGGRTVEFINVGAYGHISESPPAVAVKTGIVGNGRGGIEFPEIVSHEGAHAICSHCIDGAPVALYFFNDPFAIGIK